MRNIKIFFDRSWFAMKVCVSLLVLSLFFSNVSFSSNENNSNPISFVNNKLKEIITAPIKRTQRAIGIARSTAMNAVISNGLVKQQARRDFKWSFPAEGLTFLRPVVGVDGTVHAVTTDIDIVINVDQLADSPEEAITIGSPNSNIYALKPNAIKSKGKELWKFNTDGIIMLPPVISDDGKVFVETVSADIDLDTQEINSSAINLYAIKDGVNIWGDKVSFENSLSLASPVVAADTVLTTTIKVLDIPDVTDIDNIDIENINLESLSGVITAFDASNGNVKWTFNPASIEANVEGLPQILIAPPVVDGNTVYINTISAISLDGITELITESLTGVQDVVSDILTDTVPALLAALVLGGDTEPILVPVEDQVGDIITDIIGDVTSQLSSLGSLLALNLDDGSTEWSSRFPGISLSSPVITDSGVATVGSVNLNLDDTDAVVDIGVSLTETNLMLGAKVDITIIGVTFSVSIDVDVNLATLESDPEGSVTITTDIKDPSLDELKIDVNGKVAGFDVNDEGNLLWEASVSNPVLLKPAVSNANNKIIVGGTGFEIETSSDGGDGEDSNVNISINKITSNISAIDAVSGSLDWESDPFDGIIGVPTYDVILGDPILPANDGSVFFSFFDFNAENSGSSMKVWALDSKGDIKWSSPFIPSGLATSAPVIDTETGEVFLAFSEINIDIPAPGPDSGEDGGGETPGLKDLKPDLKSLLVSLEPSSGDVAKSVEIEGLALSSPVLDADGGTAYITTFDFEIGKRPVSFDLLSFVHAVKTK